MSLLAVDITTDLMRKMGDNVLKHLVALPLFQDFQPETPSVLSASVWSGHCWRGHAIIQQAQILWEAK